MALSGRVGLVAADGGRGDQVMVHPAAGDLIRDPPAPENQHAVAQPDEFFVVHKAHRRPRFVEDVAREMLRAAVHTYADLPAGDFLQAQVVSYESIHKHDAYAEGGGTLDELRAQIVHGCQALHCTMLDEWLG